MTRTSSRASLLHAALQDLHAGKTLLAERLPKITQQVTDGNLAALLRAETARASEQAARYSEAGVATDGPQNLWMAGILDDADRDTRSHLPGVLLDIAIVGAIRKAKAAEIVSSETALALARADGEPTLLALVEANHAEEIAANDTLRARLETLTGVAV